MAWMGALAVNGTLNLDSGPCGTAPIQARRGMLQQAAEIRLCILGGGGCCPCCRRGVYSNKLGYIAGVQLAILIAKICQFYPTAVASTIGDTLLPPPSLPNPCVHSR